jgi:hypothetical protein
MTNEQKAKRLEEIASCPLCMESTDSPLLRESAALWRERDGVRWEEGTYPREGKLAFYKGHSLAAHNDGKWAAYKDGILAGFGGEQSPTLDAAKASAVAWVDAQEGK